MTAPAKHIKNGIGHWRLSIRRLAYGSILFGLALAAYSQSVIQVGYTVVTAAPGSTVPVSTALFSYSISTGVNNSDRVLVSEAGVGAAEPISAGRIFVDEAGTLTSIALVNPSPRTASITLVLRDTTGREIDRAPLAPPLGAGEHLAKYVKDLIPSMPASFVGSLGFDSSEKLASITLRESRNVKGELLYTTLPVIDTAAPSSTAPLIFPQIAAGAGYTTQLILVNSASQRLAGTLRFIGDDGSPIMLRSSGSDATQLSYVIEPNGTFRASLDRPSGLATGYAVATPDPGSQAPAGSAVFQYKQDGFIVTEAGIAAARTTTSARIFVDNVGTYTGVALANPADAATTVNFQLLDRYGSFINSVPRTLAARGHLAIFAHELFPDDLSSSFTGLIEISSPVPVAPVTLKLTTNSRGDSVLTTLPVADLTRPPTATSIVFPQIAFGGGFATRLVFINTSRSAVSGALAFYRSTGAAMSVPLGGKTNSQFSYTLQAGAGRQFRPGDSATIASIVVPREVPVNEGKILRLEIQVVDTTGHTRDDFDLTFSSLSSDIAPVDDTGSIQGKKAGFSTLTIASGGAVTVSTITVVAINSGTSGFAITGLAQDLARRLYMANTSEHTILLAQDLKQSPTVYAGKINTAGLKNDLRSESWFRNPAFLALNQAQGTLYVSDAANNVIRSVEPGPNGKVSTLASGLNNPQGLALDNRGYLWIADSGSHTIRRLNISTGVVATIAGKSGSPGQVDGTRDAARFNSPTGLALETEPLAEQLDREGKGLPPPSVSIIVADTGNGALRRVKENGAVETLGASSAASAPSTRSAAPFTKPTGVAVDPFGNIFVTEPDSGRVSTLLRSGHLVAAVQPRTFSTPRGVAVAVGGKVVVAERTRTAAEIVFGEPRILTVTPDRFSNKGGTRVTVKGKNFAPESVVVAAGVLMSDRNISDTETITFTVPELQSGAAILTVQNRGGIAQTSLVVEPAGLRELQRGYITTVAGGSSFGGEGSRATTVPMEPVGLAVDGAGNVFIADPGNHRVRKVDARTGTITTVAGNGQFVSGTSIDNVPATATPLYNPTGVAFDSAGNLLIVDNGVRRVDATTGIITTLVKGDYGFCGDGGSALEACFNYISDIAVDRSGNLYLNDRFNHRVRRVDSRTKIVTTIAGNGQEAYSGDGGAATSAALSNPFGIAVDDARGFLYIADAGNGRIRRVDLATGIITTVAGGGDPADELGDGQKATLARLSFPPGVALDAAGNIFIADRGNNRVRRVDVVSGVITTIAGGGDGSSNAATSASINQPWGITVDSAGNALFSEAYTYFVRKVDASTATLVTVAGTGTNRPLDDGAPATAGALLSPRGVAFDAFGNMFITDTGNNRIRRVDAVTGIITTAVGGGSPDGIGDGGLAKDAILSDPSGPVVFDSDGNYYIADTYTYRVRKVDARSGKISTVAGSGPGDSTGDGGPATAAVMRPTCVGLDGRGNLYIADEGAATIRRVNGATGIITTIVGGGKPATGIGDGGRARDAVLGPVIRIAVDPLGNIFISDIVNQRIRKVDAQSQIITTIAGGGTESGDDVPATSVTINPIGIALDIAGNVLIADIYDVRRISALTGIIKSVAGGQSTGVLGDNGPAAFAFLYYPRFATVDSAGNLFIADTDNDRIRAVKGPIP